MKPIRSLLTASVVVLLVFLIHATIQAEHNTLPQPGPTLSTPINGQMTLDSTPKFVWIDQGWPTKYTVEVKFRDSNVKVFKLTYSASARCDGILCSIPSPVTFSPETYKWHVLNYDASGKQSWSNWEVFTVGNNSMSEPKLRSPGKNANVYGGRPTFKWYPVSGADAYHVNLMSATGVDLGIWKVNNPTCSPYCEFRLPYDLEQNYGVYRWRVQAMDKGTVDMSGWSKKRHFTYTQLDRVSLSFPVASTTIPDLNPQFVWSEITGATYYLFQVRTNDVAEHLVYETLVKDADACDTVFCSYTIEPMLAGDNYKWHVRAKNGRNFGRWAAYSNFTVNATDYLYYTDFSSVDPNWIDPNNKWLVDTGAGLYRGNNNGCTNCFTYFDQRFTTFTVEARIRVVNADSDDGFSLYAKTENDTAPGSLEEYHAFSIEQFTTDQIWYRFLENHKNVGWEGCCGTTYNSHIGDWHVYRMEVGHGEFKLYVDSVLEFDWSTFHPKLLDGNFGIAVFEDPGTADIEYVEIDWLTLYVDGSP